MFYYSRIEKRKSFSKRFSWVLMLKMDFEYQKMPIFEYVASNHFTRYQKILWEWLLGCKKLLNFICLTMKFCNRHHASTHLGTYVYQLWMFELACWVNWHKNVFSFTWNKHNYLKPSSLKVFHISMYCKLRIALWDAFN